MFAKIENNSERYNIASTFLLTAYPCEVASPCNSKDRTTVFCTLTPSNRKNIYIINLKLPPCGSPINVYFVIFIPESEQGRFPVHISDKFTNAPIRKAPSLKSSLPKQGGLGWISCWGWVYPSPQLLAIKQVTPYGEVFYLLQLFNDTISTHPEMYYHSLL